MYKCKYTRLCVKMAIKRMARKLKREQLVDENTVFLVMLNGGVWFSSQLFCRLGDIENEVYYIKGHSYEGKARGEFKWDVLPNVDLSGKKVVVLDDICDSGVTINAIHKQLGSQAKRMIGVTLLKRVPCLIELEMPVYACIEDGTKDFFVGCGLDDNGKGRLIRKVCIC